MDYYAADGADLLLELLDVAFPGFASAEADGWWVAVDYGADCFVFVF